MSKDFYTLLRQQILSHDGCWVVSTMDYYQWKEQQGRVYNVPQSWDHSVDVTPTSSKYTLVLRKARR